MKQCLETFPFVDRSVPLSLGVDVARFGRNNCVLFPRKGRDARTIDRRTYNGISTTELTNSILDFNPTYRPDGIFIDGGGVGGGVVDQCRNRRLFVMDIQFGGKDDITGISTDTSGERYCNKRSAMYGAVRSWLKGSALPADPALKEAMLAIRYGFNSKDEIQLVSKEDILADSPNADLDSLDALALTFGGPLSTVRLRRWRLPEKSLVITEWDPLAVLAEEMAA